MRFENKLLISFLLLLVCIPAANLFGQSDKLWLSGGQNLNNTRNAASENKITPQNAGNLQVKWVFETSGDISATPTVDEDAVYFPDWGGNLYKLNAATGKAVWSHPISYYTGVAGDFARASPAIAGNKIIIGTQLNFTVPATFDGAHVLAIDKVSGNLLWKTQVESFPSAIITQSAVVYENKVYVGVASQEEGIAQDPSYPCCSFRGSLVCLDLKTGQIIWKTYMVPEGKGFSGSAIWGSTPVIDPKRGSVYVATGNNYSVPQQLLDCVAAGGSPEQVRNCIMSVDGSAENFFDAFVSLDLNTGAVKWATSVIPFDAWNVACFFQGPNCPENAGPDYDFGQGPALFTVTSNGKKRELIGAGQKSGIYWALNPDNGTIVWSTQVGPGSTLGGLQWGSAVDEKRIYTAVSNFYYIPHTMTTGPGNGTTVYGGFWAALDAATGERIWENAGTNPPATGGFPGAVASNMGMVSVANGVMFAGAMDAMGTMYAFEASTGKKLWSFESGGSVNSGPAIVDGTVYWGSGYSNFGLGTGNHKLYAFKVGNTKNRGSIITNNNVENAATATWASVAPNPAEKGKINLIISGVDGKPVAWRLVNLQGTQLISGKFNAAGNNHKQELDLGNLAAGNYFIMVTSEQKNATLRVIKPD